MSRADSIDRRDAAAVVEVDPETVLVAIPALDEERHIEATIRSLLTGAPGLDRVRMVVADGGSADRTREIVRALSREFDNLRLIDNPDRRQSAGVNRIVELCAEPHHRILVRCDAHADYPPGYVLRVAESLAAREVAALATVMDSTGEGCFQRGAAWAIDTKLGSGGSKHRGGSYSGYVDHGHHAGFDLGWWRRVGGYEPDWGANQDAELDHRIAAAGGRIWLDADIRMGYKMRPTLRKLARQYWFYGRGRARTSFRHRVVPKLRQIAPVVVVLALAASLLAAPFAPRALAVPLAYAGLLAGASAALAWRHRSACGLWAGPALAAVHLAWGAGFLWQAATRRDRA